MPRKANLAKLSLDALFALRDEVSHAIGNHAKELQKQLAALVGSTKRRGRPPGVKNAGPRKGSKVAPKYRGPDGMTWSGRGLKPRWLVAEMKKGKTLENFLIKRKSD